MFSRRSGFLLIATLASSIALRAQSTVPAVLATPQGTTLAVGGTTTIDLKMWLGLPGVTGQVVQFDTVMGRWNAEILDTAAPVNSANFFRYVNSNSYTNTFVHRSVPGFVIQGGGYTATVPFTAISTPTSARLEYNLPNTRGTLAMARTADVNSATSQWFINLVDNSSLLGTSNGGGYTVFGRVLGTGMSVVDSIASLPLYNIGFDASGASTPLRNVAVGQSTVLVSNYVTVNSVRTVPIYPAASGDTAVLSFIATSSNGARVVVSVSGTSMTLFGLDAGVTNVTARATDTQGNSAETVFAVTTVLAPPAITAQPVGFTVAAGQPVALSVAASGFNLTYEWHQTSSAAVFVGGPTRILSSVTTADTYYCVVSNAAGSVTSDRVTVAVGAAGQISRLSNLSVRANLSADPNLIVGFSTTGQKNLLVRGVGPKLADFGITNFFADPRLEIVLSGGGAAVLNDNWDAALASTFSGLGAFALNVGSKDAAIVTPVTGGSTAQLKGAGSGTVLVEVYDAGGGFTLRMLNVSARNRVGTGGDVLIAGFTVDGPVAKTLLIRGIGPGLTVFGVGGVLADPKLEIFEGTTKRAENDDWSAELQPYFSSVGAFTLTAASKDAALLITLPPGGYTAQLSGVGGTTGEGLIEVYELP